MGEQRKAVGTDRRVATVRSFVRCINHGDIGGLRNLMTDDHLFVDGLGTRTRGRNRMSHAWLQYFRMVPGYRIQVDAVVERGTTVVVLGTAEGGYIPAGQTAVARRWKVPAAWRAVVRRGGVAEWQVYADNEPLRQLVRDEGASRRRADADEAQGGARTAS
jgi:ketosteroid isomerase-like protein